jgi:hypothetical protein
VVMRRRFLLGIGVLTLTAVTITAADRQLASANTDRGGDSVGVWQSAPEFLAPGKAATFVLNGAAYRVCFVGLIGPRRGLSTGWKFAPHRHRLRLILLTHSDPTPGMWTFSAHCIATGRSATSKIGYGISGSGHGVLASHGDMRVKRLNGGSGSGSSGGGSQGASGGSGGSSGGGGDTGGSGGGSGGGGGSSGGGGGVTPASPVLTIARAGSAGGGQSTITLSARNLGASTNYVVSCWGTTDASGNGGTNLASFSLTTDVAGGWDGTAGCTLPESLYGNLRIGPNIVWSNTVAPVATAAGSDWPSWVSSNSGWANLRASPSGDVLRYLPNNTPLLMVCWQDDVWAYGNYWTNRWFYVSAYVPENIYNQPSGWIHASLVANQTVVPQCDGLPPPNGE